MWQNEYFIFRHRCFCTSGTISSITITVVTVLIYCVLRQTQPQTTFKSDGRMWERVNDNYNYILLLILNFKININIKTGQLHSFIVLLLSYFRYVDYWWNSSLLYQQKIQQAITNWIFYDCHKGTSIHCSIKFYGISYCFICSVVCNLMMLENKHSRVSILNEELWLWLISCFLQELHI